MTGRRAVIGLSLLCALTFSALGASGASAAGKTFFTCVEGAGDANTDSHCLEKSAGKGEYGHVAFLPNVTTEIEFDKLKNLILEATTLGIKVEIVCTSATFEPWAYENRTKKEKEEEVMYIESEEFFMSYTGCSVPQPSAKGALCAIKGGEITTNKLIGTTLNENGMRFKPTKGETIATLNFVNNGENKCPFKEVAVTGSFLTIPDGAILSMTQEQTTKENTLKFGAAPMGAEDSCTLRMRETFGEKQNTISFTDT